MAIFLISFSAFANSDCSQYSDDCEYYSCVAQAKHCSDSSYPISFGKRYCLRYVEDSANLSKYGQEWLQNVRKCLIKDMTTFEDTLSCSQLRGRAFKGHVTCYVESGFCHLSWKDKARVVKTIWPSIRNVYIMASGINVLRACR
jgi:hypothetical protein